MEATGTGLSGSRRRRSSEKVPAASKHSCAGWLARFVIAADGSHARFNDADSPMLAIPRLGPDDDFHVLAERGE